ncbi:uncharacterized protein LOC131598013 [Vicia villosa]|uniref:uncharacterized protein LOC131598013 n=1 Tax=Vicia villosa TaxID=3911 RepID=UPI00273C7157|nr:uncharacterized protein LOC131598013 [Vicia villosa]
MDQIEKGLNKKQLLKRSLQLVLSISAFSIFLCYYSSGFFINTQTLNVYFLYTCFFTFFTHTLERKYMFLICNGILAFLAKNLFNVTTTSSDSESLSIVSFESLEEVGDVMVDEEYYEEKIEEVEEHKEGNLYIQNEGIDEEGGTESEIDANVDVLAQDDNDDDDGVEEETILTTDEELVNTEELNRKFEEFIRKMKEEMKIEAQRHLIAV